MKGQKMLIALVILLALGLIFQGAYMIRLKNRVDTFDRASAGAHSNLFAWRPAPSSLFSRGHSGRFNTNWYSDDFFSDEWDPCKEMRHIQRQFNRIFNESFGRGMRSRGVIPSVKEGFFGADMDIRQDGNRYIVKIDLPGMEKDKINIEIKENVLTVSGERETVSEKNKGNKFFRQEKSYGYFSRSFPLPDDAKADEISADYKNGVLTIVITRAPSVEREKEEPGKIKII